MFIKGLPYRERYPPQQQKASSTFFLLLLGLAMVGQLKDIPVPQPLITLLTDFGARDAFAGIMKGVMLGINPQVRLVDLSHDVPAQDILAGALILRSAVPFFPSGTIHLAVVDPGVGSTRRAILVETANGFLVGPDNGLLSLAAPVETVRRIVSLTNTDYFLPSPSTTFHGRDIFAPVAAHLSRGVSLDRFGPVVPTMERISLPRVIREEHQVTGNVIYVDHFGNLVTNITEAEKLPFPQEQLSVSIDAMRIQGIATSYATVPIGAFVAVINSWGLLEIAMRNGNAAQQLGFGIGCRVSLTTVE